MEATLRTIDDRYVLYFERRLSHAVEKVWQAITDPAKLSRWFPADMDMDFRQGGAIRFTFRNDEGPDGEGTISELDPRVHVFGFTWGDEALRFELRPEGSGCLLLFTHTIDDRVATARNAAGWEICLDALEALVDEKPVDGDPDRWKELHADYVERFGLDEGTVEEAPDGWVVRFERIMPKPVDAVWELLTEGSEAPEPEVITAADAPRLLEYDAGRVRWEISEDPAGSRVILTQTIPRALADQRTAALAAWHARLDELALPSGMRLNDR